MSTPSARQTERSELTRPPSSRRSSRRPADSDTGRTIAERLYRIHRSRPRWPPGPAGHGTDAANLLRQPCGRSLGVVGDRHGSTLRVRAGESRPPARIEPPRGSPAAAGPPQPPFGPAPIIVPSDCLMPGIVRLAAGSQRQQPLPYRHPVGTGSLRLYSVSHQGRDNVRSRACCAQFARFSACRAPTEVGACGAAASSASATT